MPNNILVVGKNRANKVELIDYILRNFNPVKGIRTLEVRYLKRRFGFNLETSDKKIVQFIRYGKANFLSAQKNGSYSVNIGGLDEIVAPLFNVVPDELLYIDEIGKMQLSSSRFKELVTHYLGLQNILIATLPDDYDSDFIREIEERNDTLLLNGTDNKRHKEIKGLIYKMRN